MDKPRVDEQLAPSMGKQEANYAHWGKREWAIGGLFPLLTALFYAPLLLGIRAFPDGDFAHHFFPFSLFQHQAIAAGDLPLWNPYTYGGHPFLADVQAAVYYPLSNLILLLTLPVTDAAARFYWLEVEAVLHTALAGYFAYLWARDLTGKRWGGVIGGVTFALSGYMTGYAPLQLAVLRTAIWLPLLWWCLGRGWQRPEQWRWWLGSAIALSAAFLAGHSQTFLFSIYATVAWLICLVWSHRPISLRALISTGAVGIFAFLLTAPQWLPSVEFARLSVRANVDYTFVSGGLPWQDLWQILLPGVLTQYSPLYVGVSGVVLAVVAIYAGITQRRDSQEVAISTLLPQRTGIFFCLGVTLFAALAALGGNGPLYPLLYQFAPGWAWFRGQERAAFLVTTGLSGLAAYGMALIPTLTPQSRRRGALVAGAVVVAAVYAFGLLWQLPGYTAVNHNTYLLTAGITLLIGLATALIVALPGWSARRGAWLVVLVVANLVLVNAGTNQVAGTPADRVLLAPEVSALAEAVAARLDSANGLPGRVYNEFRAYDDYGMRVQVEDVWGSSPLRVARYSSLFENFPLDRMWRLLGVEHVLTWRRELFGPSTLLAEFPQQTDTTYLHRLPTANPRAWLVSQIAVVDDAEAWRLLADHQFDVDQSALLGAENDGFTEIVEAEPFSATIALERRTDEELHVEVTSEQPGLLVVSETWLPGWEITDQLCSGNPCPSVDTEDRPFFVPMRADLTLLGIWLPAGTVAFDLRYNPQSVRLGLWIGGGGLVLLAVGTLWHLLHRRRAQPRNL